MKKVSSKVGKALLEELDRISKKRGVPSKAHGSVIFPLLLVGFDYCCFLVGFLL